MTSGLRSIVINPSERAVSSDINRAQSMSARGLAEAFRWMLDVNQGFDDTQAGGVEGQYNSPEAPMRGEVLGGLRVLVGIGNLQLGITAGLGMVIDPDSTPSTDDSPYKFVSDPGVVTTSGTLVMTPNSSGSPRIDVVECTRIQYPSPEIDSRDIFNPSTGLFTATSVTKTTESSFQYRVRAGTPGAGFPGAVTGWLPLCVASVPTGTTTNDTITFWDVRPLVSDRAFGTSNLAYDLPRRTHLHYSSEASGAVGIPFPVAGIAECTNGARRVGGRLLSGAPDSVDGDEYIDFVDPDNQEAGFGTSGSGIAYFYFLTPFGLPRWALYSTAGSGTRYPRSPRGIPLVSKTGPTHAYGQASAPIVFPAVFGFAGGVASGTGTVCWGAVTYSTASGPSLYFDLFSCTDGWISRSRTPTVNLTPATTPTTTTGTFTLTENAQIPASCKKLRMTLTVPVTTAVADALVPVKPEFTLTLPSGQEAYAQSSTQILNTNATTTLSTDLVFTFEIDVPNDYPTSSLQTYTLNYSYSGSAHATFSNPTLQILAWQM